MALLVQKMEAVRTLQGATQRADLYKRAWQPAADEIAVGQRANSAVPPTAPSAAAAAATGAAALPPRNAHKFTVAQFNVLAQGLSAGPPGSSTPFTVAKDRVGGNTYGGFDAIPHPEVSLS